jgi:NAD+ kinase
VKPRALIVGDRRRPGVVEGVEAALPFLRSRLDVEIDLDERLDLARAKADLVLVFGGDGAFLFVANRLGTNPIPVLGVNFGRLGWLAQLQPEDLETGVDAFLEGRASVTERARLRCTHRLDSRVVDEGLALNDVVVGRATLGKMVEIDVRIDGQSAITVAGDGLIVSTATGSTAHALSAGGPLLVPGLGAVVLVPICPHALGNRPLVVSRASRIEMVLGSERGPAVVTVDGREPRELSAGETVEVTDAHAPLRVVSIAGRSYYDLLRERLGWKGRPEYRVRPASARAPAAEPERGNASAASPSTIERPSKAAASPSRGDGRASAESSTTKSTTKSTPRPRRGAGQRPKDA